MRTMSPRPTIAAPTYGATAAFRSIGRSSAPAGVDGRPESSRWPFALDHRPERAADRLGPCPDAILRPDPTRWRPHRPMAKRSRLAARPGQRRPLVRPPARPDGSKPGGLTHDELARAAELEAAILAEERAAEDSRKVRERVKEAPSNEVGVRYSSTPLAVRASEEY